MQQRNHPKLTMAKPSLWLISFLVFLVKKNKLLPVIKVIIKDKIKGIKSLCCSTMAIIRGTSIVEHKNNNKVLKTLIIV